MCMKAISYSISCYPHRKHLQQKLPILSPLFVAVNMYPAVPCDFKVSRQHKEFYYQRYAIIEGDDNSAQSGPRSTQTAKGFMGVSEVAFKF
jgi:hypothetical protein